MSLLNRIAFIRMALFLKISLFEWLDKPFKSSNKICKNKLQMNLF